MKTLQKTLCILIMGLFAGVPICGAATSAEEVGVGAADTAAYFPLLRGQRVAVLANQTARVGDEHLVDLLYRCGIELTGICWLSICRTWGCVSIPIISRCCG